MSKMDDLRAMREAKYAELAKRTAAAARSPRAEAPPVAPRAATISATTPPVEAPAPGPDDAETLCGHRNMSGRTCTREHGHVAKSHRYS